MREGIVRETRLAASHPDEPVPGNGAPCERNPALVAALLRLGGSLDLDTVMGEAVENARVLTGAAYGVIATVNEGGRPCDFITSGLSEQGRRTMEEWSDGLSLFGRLRELSAPLRLPDLDVWTRSLGCSPFPLPCGAFLATPMRHRAMPIGGLFLGGKVGGFTEADEEVTMLFGSQAAAAVANAWVHLEEQNARARLEALIETCPVGMVVFDAASGAAVSLNREAKRIVSGLGMSGLGERDLLGALTCRRGDGSEVRLGDLESAETLRGEEVELSVPNGRSATMLVDVTPIPTRGGGAASVAVTMQDLEPLRELDRLRAEFLGLVSHELRAPLAAIKGSTATVLGAARDLDPAETREFHRIIDEQAEHMRELIGDLLDASRIGTRTLSVSPEPTDIGDLVEQARTAFISGGARHSLAIELPPHLPRAMADRRRIAQVLTNLFSNAARHSPETSPIRVEAEHVGDRVALSVSDDGEGIPPDRLRRLFSKYGGSEEHEGTYGMEGSGLGLAICKGLVEAHGGRIEAESGGTGRGTRFTFTIPIAGEAEEGAMAEGPGAASLPRERREPARILVVDDDPQMLRFVRNALEEAGYAAIVTGNPGEVANLVREKKPQLVLLDLVLPKTDGIELMKTAAELADLPVVFISAYRGDETMALALERGAADYIVKPFSPTELTARIGAVLRRQDRPQRFILQNLAIDYEQRLVTVEGDAVEMTATEYEILRILSVNAGRVVTYDALLRQVWEGRDAGGPALIRTFVKSLRRKLGDDAARPAYIRTERAVGYRMPKP